MNFLFAIVYSLFFSLSLSLSLSLSPLSLHIIEIKSIIKIEKYYGIILPQYYPDENV